MQSKIKLAQNTNVFFDEVSHSYINQDGELLIGVTSLMKKNGLGADYSGIPEATLKKAAEEGTALHKEIESFELGEAVLESPLIVQYKKLGLKCVAVEYLVTDDTTVASSIDGVYEGSKKNTVVLVDFKSTAKIHKHALEAQLSIYRVLFERQNPKLKVEGLFVLHLDKKTRQIKGFYPVNDLGTEWVDELIACEREGRVFVDTTEQPEASLVLSDEEISDAIAKAAKVDELKAAVKVLEDGLKSYYDKVRDYMLANNLTEMVAPGGKFVLKSAYERTSIDTAKMKKIAPELYTQCSKTSLVAASVSFKPDKDG